MQLLPAIDLRGGAAVRLVQGDFGRQREYGDPRLLATAFAAAGARWLHVVDLDAALTGEPLNRPLLLDLVRAAPVPVQAGGGIRTMGDIEELLGAGVRRVVLGTAALKDPALPRRAAEQFPDRVAVGLDYRRDGHGRLEVAVRGWVEGSGRSVEAVLDELVGAPLGAVVVTDIERDGTLEGPDLDGLATVLARTEVPVVASGGVATVADLIALERLRDHRSGRRLAGAVVGRALVDGRIDLTEAIAACAPSG
jgi:phosphoribosylformimino-5-aminoimidazole carboxamide ribotide isomerase